tara:strand:- start:1514 stop:3148 length:1635 start_codon:yes stop_codon:yes gene_type:complete
MLFTEISKPIEKKLKKIGLEQKIEVKFSGFNKDYDVQINNLVGVRKLENYDLIVAEVTKLLKSNKNIETYEISETGFVNIRLHESYIKILLDNQLKYFQSKIKKNKKKVMFDFGGANIGKSLHVGHIRTLNIGRSLKNIYDFAGFETISDIHYGDWGMPIAQIIAFIEKESLDFKTIKHDDLEKIYPLAAKLSKEDKGFYKTALNISRELNLRNETRINQWKIIYDVSTKNIISILDDLDFYFDNYLGESDVISLLPDFIEYIKKDNLAILDDDALIANDGQDPPALITKSDGSYMYLTTDIGTILYREKMFKADKYIYVVDERQKNHFNQLFKLVEFFDLSKSEFLHIGFGTVNDKNGKPLKTRDGENYKLLQLFNDIQMKLNENNSDEKTVKKLSKSVLTYSDLVTKRTGNYVFDLEKFTNISGKSAIFIQYSQVRAKKLLEQSNINYQFLSFTGTERELLIEIIKFKYYFNLSLNLNEPHHLAEYAYSLCQEFNRFYTNNKIFDENINDSLKSHRLFVVSMFYETIIKTFQCLGLEPVDNM